MDEKRGLPKLEATPTNEHKPVLVEIDGFQCMAYQDCHGKWRRFYDLELLPGDVEVVSVN